MSLTRIEFVNIASVEDFYQQLEAQLDLQFGLEHSLEAIYDALSTGIDGPLSIVWHDTGFSRVALGEDYVHLIDTLNTVVMERADISISLN